MVDAELKFSCESCPPLEHEMPYDALAVAGRQRVHVITPADRCPSRARMLEVNRKIEPRGHRGDDGHVYIVKVLSKGISYVSTGKKAINATTCIKGESNPRRVDGNDPGYHYPINATREV